MLRAVSQERTTEVWDADTIPWVFYLTTPCAALDVPHTFYSPRLVTFRPLSPLVSVLPVYTMLRVQQLF